LNEQKIIIIDYDMGNLGSIRNMLKHLGVESSISADLQKIGMADKLILSGVGSFDEGMKNLTEKGLIESLTSRVLIDQIPILGICLGMQLYTKSSEEGILPGLGWIEAKTVRFNFNCPNSKLKIPHMGWNGVTVNKLNPLFENMTEESRFYFVHSYYLECANQEDILCRTVHGHEFTSAVARNNIYGVQFHPEKSHRYGMQILKNFVELA
jgi:imidazole glycerol-phosphate synthase subunit HisH